MLKLRIIPTLLFKNVGLVKGIGFNSSRRVGSVLPAVNVYNSRDVDELVLLDITATSEGREPDYALIEEVAANCFVPLSVGGGVSSIEIVKKLLRSGADKVIINTASYLNNTLISESAYKFGSQCLITSIDVRCSNGVYQCSSHSGTCLLEIEPKEWGRQLENLGAGEILLTSIDRDGTMLGYDTTLLKEVSSAVKIPVIAAGGAGCYQHMYEAVKAGASAVAAASMFHFTEQTPHEAKQFLKEVGIPVRI